MDEKLYSDETIAYVEMYYNDDIIDVVDTLPTKIDLRYNRETDDSVKIISPRLR